MKIGWIIALRRDRCGPGLAGIIFKIINLKSITEKLPRSAAQPWISVSAFPQGQFAVILITTVSLHFQPMPLLKRAAPFDDPDWILVLQFLLRHSSLCVTPPSFATAIPEQASQ